MADDMSSETKEESSGSIVKSSVCHKSVKDMKIHLQDGKKLCL